MASFPVHCTVEYTAVSMFGQDLLQILPANSAIDMQILSANIPAALYIFFAALQKLLDKMTCLMGVRMLIQAMLTRFCKVFRLNVF